MYMPKAEEYGTICKINCFDFYRTLGAMKQSPYLLDPEGDIELTLRCPNSQELQWSTQDLVIQTQKDQQLIWWPESDEELPVSSTKKGKKKKKRPEEKHESLPESTLLSPAEEEYGQTPSLRDIESTTAEGGGFGAPVEFPSQDVSAADPNEAQLSLDESTSYQKDGTAPEIRMRVSSRHLCLASHYFEKMLSGPWKERLPKQEGLHKIYVHDWDAEALVIVFDIIHGHHRSVPRSISLEMLAKTAAIVDYFGCHEAVDIFADVWIQSLKGQIPKSYGKESILWLSISCVFSRRDLNLKQWIFRFL
ncbi:hypothetical protein S40288_09676 [Stachybotrys chartarum IBT 40288]|nr:hypothetical protein S40288_09676 [Stachybotrys chartarum IBT 40288]